MRKTICLITALVLCLSMASPAFASENDFVPSITYKPGPEIVPIDEYYIGIIRDQMGNIIEYVGKECIQITPVAKIWDELAQISEPVKNVLSSVFNTLKDGSMKLPYEKHNAGLNSADMVIRDLFDVSWSCEDHSQMVGEDGVAVQLTFDLGVDENARIYAMSYDESENTWEPIADVVNNGDGTVTCTFEHFCPVEFSVVLPGHNGSAGASDEGGIIPWTVAMGLAGSGLIALAIARKKKAA